MPITNRVQNHIHRWTRGRKFTSMNDGHRHKISFNKRTALSAGRKRHTHKLIGGL